LVVEARSSSRIGGVTSEEIDGALGVLG